MDERTDSSELSPPKPTTVPAWRWTLGHLEEIITAILLAMMIGSIGIGVFWRYALRQPISWTEEVVLICMVWTCFLGASIATKNNEHIFIDFVVSLVPPRVGRTLEIFSMALITGVLTILLWQGIRLVDVTQDVTTIALGIPTMYMYAAIPVSALLMLIHNARNLLSALLSWT